MFFWLSVLHLIFAVGIVILLLFLQRKQIIYDTTQKALLISIYFFVKEQRSNKKNYSNKVGIASEGQILLDGQWMFSILFLLL